MSILISIYHSKLFKFLNSSLWGNLILLGGVVCFFLGYLQENIILSQVSLVTAFGFLVVFLLSYWGNFVTAKNISCKTKKEVNRFFFSIFIISLILPILTVVYLFPAAEGKQLFASYALLFMIAFLCPIMLVNILSEVKINRFKDEIITNRQRPIVYEAIELLIQFIEKTHYELKGNSEKSPGREYLVKYGFLTEVAQMPQGKEEITHLFLTEQGSDFLTIFKGSIHSNPNADPNLIIARFMEDYGKYKESGNEEESYLMKNLQSAMVKLRRGYQKRTTLSRNSRRIYTERDTR